jgi:hypothetical protein
MQSVARPLTRPYLLTDWKFPVSRGAVRRADRAYASPIHNILVQLQQSQENNFDENRRTSR